MIYTELEIKWGKLIAGVNLDGSIAGLWIEHQKHFPKISEDAIWLSADYKNSTKVYCEVYKTLEVLKHQLKLYETGELKIFDLNLSPSGTAFQEMVWQILCHIPYGETVTYGYISSLVAKEMGRKTMSAQAVGSAVGHNPISIIIPCHRVLGADGSLTGYAGGLDTKMALLIHEGVKLEEQLSFDF